MIRVTTTMAFLAALSSAIAANGAAAQAPPPEPPTHGDHILEFRAQPGSQFLVDTDSATAAGVAPGATAHGVPPVDDSMVFWHVLFDQLEGRTNLDQTELRWEGLAWVGTDFNRLVLKTEGFLTEHGDVEDGDQELLYARPISFLRYFDWQAGVRYDWDSAPGRLWGALGFQGLAPGFFDLSSTLYVRDGGHVAARIEGSYDLLLTNRLIVQPQAELNFYSKDDPARDIGSGLSDIDTGLRIRYELTRKFAPYVGIAYNGKFGETADLARAQRALVDDVRFVFGTRLWF